MSQQFQLFKPSILGNMIDTSGDCSPQILNPILSGHKLSLLRRAQNAIYEQNKCCCDKPLNLGGLLYSIRKLKLESYIALES